MQSILKQKIKMKIKKQVFLNLFKIKYNKRIFNNRFNKNQIKLNR